ncbi:MAG TPA: sulfite exporter TauE/SafE family protein [Candidatus Eisenbacteria bacterium]|nr:sulfite exporter TauE/SafE family protein [Candidatus Eisenbacteria bacterium]
MSAGKTMLLALLAALGTWFAVAWAGAVRGARMRGAVRADRPPSLFHLAVGFVTEFLDTLGIGSFATTTTAYRLARGVDDRLLPGTLNVGHALPTIAQALIYVTILVVDMTTLVAMIGAAVGGAWLGSGVVAGWPRRTVRVAMGSALVVAAMIMLGSVLGWLPKGGDAVALSGVRLAVGIAGNFVLGALMTIGIGLYAPCLILVSLLGMSPTAAFPIMMGSCAFLMPVGSMRFIRRDAYDLRAALGLTWAGIPGVLVAAFLVRSLSLDAVRWLVIVVVTYTAATMLAAARREA